jgi:general secretion pathway protein D
MMFLRLVLVLILTIAVGGCQQQIHQAPGPPPTPLQPGAGAPAPRVSGPVIAQQPLPPQAAISPGVRQAPEGGAPAQVSGGQITLDFVDTDVREIARTVLGQLLRVTFTIDPAVHGTGTIQTAGPVSREKALQLLGTVLSQNGATISVSNGIYRVTSSTAAGQTPNLVGGDTVSAGTAIVRLRYASAADLATVLQPFVTPGTKIVADAQRNVLAISGDAVTRNSLVDVARAFDTDALAGKSFALFPVNSDDPGKVADQLNRALQTGEKGALANVVQVVPMERVNAVLVVSSQAQYINDVRRIFALVNRVSHETVRTWHVYYVRNGQSGDLEYVLQRAFTPDNVTSTGETGTQKLGSTVPGLQLAQGGGMMGGGAMGGGMPGGTFGGGGIGGGTPGGGIGGTQYGGTTPSPQISPTGQQTGQTANAAAPATQALSPEEKGPPKDTIRIIANRTNNALLIYATPQEYRMIEAMLNKIDILPLQVEIDAVIAEVDLNDALQYGVQFYFKSGGLSGILSQNSSGLPLSANFPGFVLEKTSGAVQYTLSALQNITNVRVLSSPQITVLDNETATISVGDQVPYLTQTASILSGTTTVGAPIVNSIAYENTGVILQVIPRVNSGGLVTLDIAQEVSQPVTTTTSSIGSPTFADRSVKSRVVVHDGQTIGLAGLISDNDSRTNGGLPFVKDIPLIGTVFSNQNNSRMRTELLVLLTPHVDYDQRAVQELTEDLRVSLSGPALVPNQLRTLPASGSADPNMYLFGGH